MTQADMTEMKDNANRTADPFNIQIADTLTFNVEPLLHEVKHALRKLIEQKRETIIDLRSLPLAPGEEQRIIDTLGHGEVSATLDALGKSDIYETAFTGVWLITHYNDEDAIIGRFIEVTVMPEILMSQRQDIEDARDRLDNLLNEM